MTLEFSHFAEHASRYPYFWVVLTGSLTVLVAAAVLKRYRGGILFSGLAGVTPGALAPAFEGIYWQPVRLAGGSLGVEDLLCGFSVTGLLWACHCLVFPGNCQAAGTRGSWNRCLALGLLSLPVFFLVWWLRWDGLLLAVVQPLFVLVCVLWQRPSLWPCCVSGFASFTVLWWAALRASFWVSPGFARQWNREAWFGADVAGVPLGELCWAACLGACWPAFVIWCVESVTTRDCDDAGAQGETCS